MCGSKSNRSDSSSGTNSGSSSNNSSTTGLGTINGRSKNGSIMDKTYHPTAFASSPADERVSKLKQSNFDQNYNGPAFDGHYHRHLSGVPISICVMILICYVTLGAALFHRLQSWNVLESLYFCFSSLVTIGFGELEPKGYTAQYVASAYILVGMAIVAMCFRLIRAELSAWTYRINDNHSTTDEKPNAMPHVISHVPHHNHMMHQISNNTDDVALVTVAVTPKS